MKQSSEPDNLGWQTPEKQPVIRSDQIHLWRVRLDGVGYQDDSLAAVLSAEELARAQRFVFDRHRERFIRTHAVCRIILSGYTGGDPAILEFGAAARGKPFLLPAPNRLRFNLSHSGDLMILGIAIDHDLGVDVEVINQQMEWKQIAANFFNAYETETIASLPTQSEQLAAFYRVWTLKEAYLKARGDGLAGGLDRVVVNLDETSPERFLSFPDGENEKRRWQVKIFHPAAGACGAVIAQRGQFPYKFIQYDWKEAV